jgi:hypothetical protein
MALADAFAGEQEMSRSELGRSSFSRHDTFLRKGDGERDLGCEKTKSCQRQI